MAKVSRRKLRYSVLKEFDAGNQPTHETFDITYQEYIMFLKEFQNDGYMDGIIFTKTHILFEQARITPLGEQCIDENSKLSKMYKMAKELRDWIKP